MAGMSPPDDTTIVAPATPGGTGAISVVRLSGPDAFQVAGRLTGLSPSDAPPRALRRCPVSYDRRSSSNFHVISNTRS